jgi:hypothetical protein
MQKTFDAYETNAIFCRILVIPFRRAQVTYLTFVLLTLQTFTKLKTTFRRNLLYWML